LPIDTSLKTCYNRDKSKNKPRPQNLDNFNRLLTTKVLKGLDRVTRVGYNEVK